MHPPAIHRRFNSIRSAHDLHVSERPLAHLEQARRSWRERRLDVFDPLAIHADGALLNQAIRGRREKF
jgi:hypothetical protein